MILFKKLMEIEKSGFTLIVGLLFSLFFTHPVNAQDAIWLSNTPPGSMEKGVEVYGMHRLSVLKTINEGKGEKAGLIRNKKVGIQKQL